MAVNQLSKGHVSAGKLTVSGDVAFPAGTIGTTELASNAVTTAKLDVSTIQYAEVSIAAAAVATLRATPVSLVAAPGAGKVIEFISAILILDYTAPGYTETDDNLAVKYTNGSGVAVSETIEMTGFIDLTADAMIQTQAIKDALLTANAALVLHNTGSGEFGNSGGSALRVKVAYRVHSTGL